jgi:FkbM family methyltransferase
LREFIPFNNGFFIEAGANDGVSQSNTLYFEKYCRWRGLLIEPIPELAALCRRNRPACIVENCALVPLGFPLSEIKMHYCNLMSLVAGARGSEDADLAHIRTGMEVQAGIIPYSLNVLAWPLSKILDKYDIKRIDMLSLDVEGYEVEALQGIDFFRHQPKYILVETSRREEIDALLYTRYRPVAQLSCHDHLYRLQTN